MSKMVTAAMIRTIVEKNIEDDPMPAILLAYLRERDGKQLTKRDEPKLAALAPGKNVRIRKQYGMTNIGWEPEEGKSCSLLIAHHVGTPVIDAAYIEESNSWCFRAREERNARRAAVLKTNGTFDHAAAAINNYNSAVETLRYLTSYGEALSDDGIDILKAFTPSWYERA